MKSENGAESDNINDLKMWKLWGIPLFGRGESQVLKLVEDQIDTNNNKPFWIATVNTEFVMEALKDREFFNLLQNTDLNVIDGVGLIWAKMVKGGENFMKAGVEIMQGKHREALVTGVELTDKMCQLAEQKKWRVFFLGGWGDRGKRTAEYFRKKYPKLMIEGSFPGNYDLDISQSEELKREMDKKVEILFVCYGMKRQEMWIRRNIDKLNCKIVVGLGRTFDYYSGALPRAPAWMRKMGLEWLYSLYKQPRRWKRQLALPKFVGKVLTEGN